MHADGFGVRQNTKNKTRSMQWACAAKQSETCERAPRCVPPTTIRCAVCESTFRAVLQRRRHHCRNCGRLVCTTCALRFWPRSMLPHSYRTDRCAGGEWGGGYTGVLQPEWALVVVIAGGYIVLGGVRCDCSVNSVISGDAFF